MSRYRVEMAFYVEAESADNARLTVEDGITAPLAADYDWLTTEPSDDRS